MCFYVCPYICILYTLLMQENMRNKFFIILLSSFIGCLLANFNEFPKIVILGSANVHGEIEPCGWKKKPLGGLARKATIIDQIKQEGVNPIIVDAGNLFFKNTQRTIGLNNEIGKINAETIVNSFNILGCDAFSVGANDLSDGLNYLLKLKNDSKFPFISANIVDKSNRIIFDPYVIVERDVKIGFIGLASAFSHSEVSVLDPLDALSNIEEAPINATFIFFDSISFITYGLKIRLLFKS